jgi:tetratricopeptide (TPR) repeat protein/DNA-binding CsgD family transcriptional regulator
MKYYVLTLIFFLYPVIIFAQFTQKKIDSTKNILKQKNITFNTKMKAYEHLINIYSEVDAKKSYEYAKEFYQDAQKMSSNEKGYAQIFFGIAYRAIGQTKKSIEYYKKALDLGYKSKNKWLIAEALRGLGIANVIMGAKGVALEYFFRIIEMFEDEESRVKSGAYHYIQTIYKDQKQYEKAMYYSQKELEMWHKKRIGNSSGILSEIGNIYYAQAKYEKALECYKKGFEEAIKANNIHAKAYCVNNIGLVAFKQQKFEEAEKYFFQSIEFSEKVKNIRSKVNTQSNLVQLYNEQKDYRKALELGMEAHQNAIKIYDLPLIIEITEVLSNIYRNNKDFENSYKFKDLAYTYKDSLDFNKQAKEVFMLEMHQTILKQKIDKDIISEQYKFWFWISISAFLAVIGLMIAIILFIKRNQLKQEIITQHIKIVEDLQKQRVLETKITSLEKLRLQEKMHFQARQLATQSALLTQKNKWLLDIEEKLKFVQEDTSLDKKTKFKNLFIELKQSINAESEWETYKLQFEQVHPNFFEILQKKFPKLTNNDLRICAYIQMNLGNKEIANMLHVTAGSLKVNFNRLKKKLQLNTEDNLKNFVKDITKIENQRE